MLPPLAFSEGLERDTVYPKLCFGVVCLSNFVASKMNFKENISQENFDQIHEWSCLICLSHLSLL